MKKQWKAGYPCVWQAAKRVAEIRKASDEELQKSDYPQPSDINRLMKEILDIRKTKVSFQSSSSDEYD